MRMMLSVATAALLGGCAYTAPVSVSPNLNVYSSFDDRLPGTYLLFVEAESLNTIVRPTGINCSAHTYPLDARQAFRLSALGTIRQLVEEVELVERPVSAESLARAGKTGMIIIRADTLTARIHFIDGFWSSTAESTVELAASISVNTNEGRALGSSAGGDSTQQASAGACDAGAEAVGRATELAIREALGQLGERMSNSPRLRHPPEPASEAVSSPRAREAPYGAVLEVHTRPSTSP